MEEQGVVVSIPRQGFANVMMARSAACQGCAACSICRPSEGSGGMVIEAKDPIGVSPGQDVLLSVPAANVLKASLAVYLLPLAVLLAVGAVVMWLAAGLVPPKHLNLVAVLAGLAGMALTYYILMRFFKDKAEEALRPTIIDARESA